MHYPPDVSADEIERQFVRSVRTSLRSDGPYRHWKVQDVFPADLCTGILTMPICPPNLGVTNGTRGSYNYARCFLTPKMRADYPCVQALADALQRPTVARLMADTCEIDVEGSYLRMEYMQDIDGSWLEPHRDIPEKLFSMVIYLFTGPNKADWGTDIYDADKRWVGRSAPDFDSGVIFVPGPATWHGFDKRPIVGVRRLMEINYVRPSWRDRDQLTFPDRPISLK
jgi:hypothetical protein